MPVAPHRKSKKQSRKNAKKNMRKTRRNRAGASKIGAAVAFVRDVNKYMSTSKDTRKKEVANIKKMYKKHYGTAPKNPDMAKNIQRRLHSFYAKGGIHQRGGMAAIPEAYTSHPYSGTQGGLTQKPTDFQAYASGGRPEVGQVQANSPHEVPPSSRNQQVTVLAGYQQQTGGGEFSPDNEHVMELSPGTPLMAE